MTKMVAGRELGKELCELFNLPDTTYRIAITAATEDVARVHCEFFLWPEGREGLLRILKNYELTPVKETMDLGPSKDGKGTEVEVKSDAD